MSLQENHSTFPPGDVAERPEFACNIVSGVESSCICFVIESVERDAPLATEWTAYIQTINYTRNGPCQPGIQIELLRNLAGFE